MEVSRASQAQNNHEEERWEAYVKERRLQHNTDLNAMEADQQKEIEQAAIIQKKQIEDVGQAYKVELSREREKFEKTFESEQKSHEVALKAERESHEKEFEKIREREKARIDSYRKNQDQQIERLHEKYQAAAEEMQKGNS